MVIVCLSDFICICAVATCSHADFYSLAQEVKYHIYILFMSVSVAQSV